MESPGIEIFDRETRLAAALPSRAPAVPPVIGLLRFKPVTAVHPVLLFGVKEDIVEELI